MTSLPQQLDLVPEDKRLREAQGVGFAGVGVGALVVFVGYALHGIEHGLAGDAWKFLLGSAVVAAGGFLFEVLRRKKPLVLVPLGDRIGAYKNGQLVHTFAPHQLTLYQLSWVNTFRELMVFGMFGAMATFGALFMLRMPSLGTAWTWGIAISLDALAYSSALTRVASRQYYLPAEVTPEAVAFRKSELQRVGWSG